MFRVISVAAIKTNKVSKTEELKLNVHISFESVILLYPELSKSAQACRNHSLPKLARFFETQYVLCSVTEQEPCVNDVVI